MSLDDFKTVAEIFRWPLAVCIIAIASLLFLKKSITSLANRARRAGFGDKMIEFNEPSSVASEQKKKSQQSNSGISERGETHEAPPPPATDAVSQIETPVKRTIDESSAPTDTKIAWLIRGYAQEKLHRIHEQNYRLILGGQISVLLQANSAVTTHLSDARLLYETSKVCFPVIYENFAFEDWISWPKNVGLITIDADNPSDPTIRITVAGKDFMIYLVASGLTGVKPG